MHLRSVPMLKTTTVCFHLKTHCWAATQVLPHQMVTVNWLSMNFSPWNLPSHCRLRSMISITEPDHRKSVTSKLDFILELPQEPVICFHMWSSSVRGGYWGTGNCGRSTFARMCSCVWRPEKSLNCHSSGVSTSVLRQALTLEASAHRLG